MICGGEKGHHHKDRMKNVVALNPLRMCFHWLPGNEYSEITTFHHNMCSLLKCNFSSVYTFILESGSCISRVDFFVASLLSECILSERMFSQCLQVLQSVLPLCLCFHVHFTFYTMSCGMWNERWIIRFLVFSKNMRIHICKQITCTPITIDFQITHLKTHIVSIIWGNTQRHCDTNKRC